MGTIIKVDDGSLLVAKLWVKEEGKLFHIFLNDTLETICNRYVKEFPEQAFAFVKEMKEIKDNLANENGISSDLKLFRLAVLIPYPIYYAVKYLDERVWHTDFWNKANKQNYRKLQQIMPKLFIGKM